MSSAAEKYAASRVKANDNKTMVGAFTADYAFDLDPFQLDAIRAIESSEASAIDHFVMVSAARADVPLAAPPAMRHYMVAKKVADDRLISSSVPHTILRPGRLTDEPGSGTVRTELAGGEGFDISRQNVALCILAALESASSRNRVVDLLDGDQPIASLFPA